MCAVPRFSYSVLRLGRKKKVNTVIPTLLKSEQYPKPVRISKFQTLVLLSKFPSIFIKNSENKRYITLVPLVCFAKCGCLTLLGQPQPHISSYFHFTRNNWTKRENLSLKRSTQVSFYFQTLGPGALCLYWLALQDSFRTSLLIRSFSL